METSKNTIPRNAKIITVLHTTQDGQKELAEIVRTKESGYIMKTASNNYFRVAPDHLRIKEYFTILNVVTENQWMQNLVKAATENEKFKEGIENFITAYNKEYSSLYDEEKPEDKTQIELFECYMKVYDNFKIFVNAFCQYRGDILTSDREINAFMNVADALQLTETLLQNQALI